MLNQVSHFALIHYRDGSEKRRYQLKRINHSTFIGPASAALRARLRRQIDAGQAQGTIVDGPSTTHWQQYFPARPQSAGL